MKIKDIIALLVAAFAISFAVYTLGAIHGRNRQWAKRPMPSIDGHRFIIGGNGYELMHDPECPKCKEEQP